MMIFSCESLQSNVLRTLVVIRRMYFDIKHNFQCKFDFSYPLISTMRQFLRIISLFQLSMCVVDVFNFF